MRVYIAGGSTEAAMVAVLMDQLRAAGVEVTQDWPACVLAHQAEGRSDADLTDAERERESSSCLSGIDRSDVVWYAVPEARREGPAVEIGYAIGRGTLLLVSGPHRRRSIFTSRASWTFETHVEALAFLVRRAAARRPATCCRYHAARGAPGPCLIATPAELQDAVGRRAR